MNYRQNERFRGTIENLSDDARDRHRTVVSRMEELQVVAWYKQKVDACRDGALKALPAQE